MDEKTQKAPQAQTQLESSGRTDSAPAKDDIDQNIESFESVESEPESIGSEKKAKPDYTIDNPETTKPIDNAYEDTEQEPEGPDTEPGPETLPSGANDDDGDEALEKVKQSNTEAGDHKRGGMDTADKVEEEVSHSDSNAIDDVAEIQGSSEEKPAIEETDEKQENKGNVEDGDQAVLTQNEPEKTEAEEKVEDIAEGKTVETPLRKNSVFKVAVSAIIIAAAFSGFFVFGNKSKVKANPHNALNTPEKTKILPNRQKKAKINKPATSIINNLYNAKIEELTSLRDRLLLKQEEIMRLKKRYQDGVEELENEISDELQKGKSDTFLQAMEDSAIAFTLRTIQRRQVYIQQLEGPSSWIHQACEELLYIKRQTMIDLQIAEIAGGIDMNKHLRHIKAAVRKYQPTADKLAPDMTNAQLEPLETIWNRIQDKTKLYASTRAHSQNQIISEQICAGIFNRLSELSDISAKTAKCITEMQASDLFLNDLNEISPAAARQLFQWKGNWICLNGVRALSPRAAHYLFQWDGNLISLNGLTEFPAEVGEKLLQWEGQHLELMGLQYAEDFPTRIALEYLARWERTGGKLFVPKEVRKKIDELHGEST
jgi:hypothetical protein